jgi:hypothetical protein
MMKNNKLIKYSIALGLLVSGYSTGTVLTSASNDDNAPVKLEESTEVAPLAQEVKIAKSELKADFKSKIKMPKKLPFKVNKILANTDDMGSRDQTDDLQAYEQFFWGDDGTLISVRVHHFVPNVHYEDNANLEKVKLKNNDEATYYYNGYAESIDWIDKETGYQYMVTKYLDKNKKAKVSKDAILEMVNSFELAQ